MGDFDWAGILNGFKSLGDVAPALGNLGTNGISLDLSGALKYAIPALQLGGIGLNAYGQMKQADTQNDYAKQILGMQQQNFNYQLDKEKRFAADYKQSTAMPKLRL